MAEEHPSGSSVPEPLGRGLQPEQREIKEELRRLALPLADLYEAAVIFASSPGFPGCAHFLGHSVREIGNSLPDALEEAHDRRQFDWKQQLRDLQCEWDKAGMEEYGKVKDDLPNAQSPEVPSPWPLYTKIRDMLGKFRASDERVEYKVIRVFRNLAPELLVGYG